MKFILSFVTVIGIINGVQIMETDFWFGFVLFVLSGVLRDVLMYRDGKEAAFAAMKDANETK